VTEERGRWSTAEPADRRPWWRGADGGPFLVIAPDERAIIFRLGRYRGVRGPGWVWPLWFIDRAIRVSLRARHSELATTATTADGVSADVVCAIDWRVADPAGAIININNYERALRQAAEVECARILTQSSFAAIDADPAAFEEELFSHLTQVSGQWGLEVSAVRALTLDPG
jgi:regulator of protease activity HflC (stomatin/prohibitin superfamily)